MFAKVFRDCVVSVPLKKKSRREVTIYFKVTSLFMKNEIWMIFCKRNDECYIMFLMIKLSHFLKHGENDDRDVCHHFLWEVIVYLLVYSPPWVSCQWEAWQSTKCRCQARSFGFRHWLKLSSSDNRDAPCRSSRLHPLEIGDLPYHLKELFVPWFNRYSLA
jgi:hypothetical protein